MASQYLQYLRLLFPKLDRILCSKQLDATQPSALFGVYDLATFERVTFDARMYEPISNTIEPVDARAYNVEHTHDAFVYPTHDLVYYDLKLWIVVACDDAQLVLHQLNTYPPQKEESAKISLQNAVHAYSMFRDDEHMVRACLVSELHEPSGISTIARILQWLKNDWYVHHAQELTLSRERVFPINGSHLYLRFGCGLKKHPKQICLSPFGLVRRVSESDEELDVAVSLNAITKQILFQRVRLLSPDETPRVNDLALFTRVFRTVSSFPVYDKSVHDTLREEHTVLPRHPRFWDTADATLILHNLRDMHKKNVNPDCLSLWSSSFVSPFHSWWLQAVSFLTGIDDALWTAYTRRLLLAENVFQEDVLLAQDVNFVAQWRYRVRLCMQVVAHALDYDLHQKHAVTTRTRRAYEATIRSSTRTVFASRTMETFRDDVPCPPTRAFLVKTALSPGTLVYFTVLKLFGTMSSYHATSDSLEASFRLRVEIMLIERTGKLRADEQTPHMHTFTMEHIVPPFFGGMHAGSLSVFTETPQRDGVMVPDELMRRTNYTQDVLNAADNVIETIFPSSSKVRAQWYAYLSQILGDHRSVRDIHVIGSHVPIFSPEYASSPQLNEPARLMHEVIDILLAVELDDDTHRCIAVYTTPIFGTAVNVSDVPCHYATVWSSSCFHGTIDAMLHIWATTTTKDTISIVHHSFDADGFACQTGDLLCSLSTSFSFCCSANADAFVILSEMMKESESRPWLACPESDLFHALFTDADSQPVYLCKETNQGIFLLYKKKHEITHLAPEQDQMHAAILPAPVPPPPPDPLPSPVYRPHEEDPSSFAVNERVYPANESMMNRNLRVQINIAVEQAGGFLMGQANQAWAPFRAFLGNGSDQRRGWTVQRFFDATRQVLNGITDELLVVPNQNFGGAARAQDSGRNGYPYAESLTYEEATTAILRLSVRAIHRSINDKLLRAHDLAIAGQQQANLTQAPFHYPNAPGVSTESLARETMSNSQRATMRTTALQEVHARIAATRDALRQMVVQLLPLWINLAPV